MQQQGNVLHNANTPEEFDKFKKEGVFVSVDQMDAVGPVVLRNLQKLTKEECEFFLEFATSRAQIRMVTKTILMPQTEEQRKETGVYLKREDFELMNKVYRRFMN